MEKMKASRVRGSDMGPNNMRFFDWGDNKGPILQCDPGDEGSKAVTCTSSSDIKSLDGGEPERTNSGASAEHSTGDGDGDDRGGNDATMEENIEEEKPQKRAVRANLYAFIIRDTIYHIEIKSSLGETYRNLATKAEQREFMIKHGMAKPYNPGGRLWAVR